GGRRADEPGHLRARGPAQARSGQRGCVPLDSAAAARPADRRRRARQRLLLRDRTGQGQGDQGDADRRRVRAGALRLPVEGAVRERLVLPGRRPRRPRGAALPAAGLGPGDLRRDRADPARGADRGMDPALTPPIEGPTAASSLSFWHDSLPESIKPRASLPADRAVDVAIVGAGYTGLWTAYYLKKAEPSARIAVLDANFAGFGASGRNGGWCSAIFPSSLAKVAKVARSRAAAAALQRALNETVDEVGRVVAAERIDCHYTKGGTIVLARSAVQLARAREDVAESREFGFGEADLRLLSALEAEQH